MSLDFITALERFECTKLVRQDFIRDAWIVGGALNRKESKDIDILVHTKTPMDRYYLNYMSFGSFEIASIHEQYGVMDGGKDLIVKLTHPRMRNVDLLFTCTHMESHWTIQDYMRRYFPLSIQMKAVSLFTWESTGLQEAANWVTSTGKFMHLSHMEGVIFCKGTVSDDFYVRYRNYFPEHTFFLEMAPQGVTPTVADLLDKTTTYKSFDFKLK